MNKKELTTYLERIEAAKDFVESPEYKVLHQEAVDTCTFLERFGTMADVINHLRMLEERVYIIKEYLTLDEVARYLQVSKHTVYKLTSANEITFYKPNGFVPKKELMTLEMVFALISSVGVNTSLSRTFMRSRIVRLIRAKPTEN